MYKNQRGYIEDSLMVISGVFIGVLLLTAEKYFSIQTPWACYANVKVMEVK